MSFAAERLFPLLMWLTLYLCTEKQLRYAVVIKKFFDCFCVLLECHINI